MAREGGWLMAMQGFYYALYMSQFRGKAPAGAEAVDLDLVSTLAAGLNW